MDDEHALRWNNNIHYQQLIFNAVPRGAQSALDVGTGNGLLAAELHQSIPDVAGIDPNAAMLVSAHGEDHGVTWIR